MCRKMDECGNYYSEGDNLDSDRQISHGLFPMWILAFNVYVHMYVGVSVDTGHHL